MAETLNTNENGNCANRVLATVPFDNDDFYDDDFDEYDDDFDEYDNDDDDYYYERKQEELQERAVNCTCGAWKLGKSGEVYHVADCCCGAE